MIYTPREPLQLIAQNGASARVLSVRRVFSFPISECFVLELDDVRGDLTATDFPATFALLIASELLPFEALAHIDSTIGDVIKLRVQTLEASVPAILECQRRHTCSA